MASSNVPHYITDTEGSTWIKRFSNLPATVTLHTVIGGRKSQEDRFCVCPKLVQHMDNVAFFGVFDGTVGDFASNTVKDLVVPMLKSTNECKKLEHEAGALSESDTTELLKRSMRKMYHKSDEELLRRAGVAEKHYAASTSVTLLLWEDYICVGHLGDSRICLIYITDENLKKIQGEPALADANSNSENTSGTENVEKKSAKGEDVKKTGGYVVDERYAAPGSIRTDSLPANKVEDFVEGNFVTQDHKPDQPEEKARIEANGGSVEYLHNHQNKPFIRGGDFQQRKMLGESPMQLQYSRAFGAKDLKPFGLLGDPTVNCTRRERQFMGFILASDGLWDVLSADVASRVAAKAFLTGQNPSEALVQAAIHTSCDNITAVCVMYDTLGGDRS
mmetsp:Transcript_22236/g.56107  ORF Transcript_22236/g.56107 Transcript_22236/m.56107 type:complete len:390 (+) Transcript_22236:461-1630(+)|eukprot:g5162.t1